MLSSPSGEQDDETWLESLQRDVKLVEPPGAAWDLSKTDIRRHARNPTYKPRLSSLGRRLVWLEYYNNIYEDDDDLCDDKRARARRTKIVSEGRHGRLAPGKLEVICAKYQVSPKTAGHIWSGTFQKKGPQHRDDATAHLRKIYGEKGVKGVFGV